MWRAAGWGVVLALAGLAHWLDSAGLRGVCAAAVLTLIAANAPRALLAPLALLAAIAVATWIFAGAERLADLLPALIAAFVAWLFARTLLGQRRPLIARAIVALDGAQQLEDARIASYARRLTVVWALYQTLLALLALWLALAPPPGWPGPRAFGAFGLPGAVLALLLLEFFLRRRLLPQAPRHSLVGFLSGLVRAWPRLLED